MSITTAWTTIATTQTDANSPLDQTLFDSIRGNGYHNYDWIGLSYTPADNHNHNGTNSAQVHAGGLYTSTSEVAAADGAAANVYPTNTAYAFYPQFRTDSSGNVSASLLDTLAGATLGSSSKLAVYLNPEAVLGATKYLYARFTYVAASPPYSFGGVDDWGEFLFLRRNASDGTIISSSTAPDPVWEGPHSPLPKGHPARIAQIPHPFADFHAAKLPEGEEIVLVDLRHLQEPELWRPEQARYTALVAKRAEFIAMGIDAAEVERYEVEQQQRAAAELAEQMAAQSAHDALLDKRQALIDAAPERIDMQAGVIDMSQPKPRFTKATAAAYVDSRCAVLRKQAGYLTRIEAIKRNAEMQGSSLLQLVNEGKLPDAIGETEIAKDDLARLPQVAQFKDAVRVLRAANV